MLSLDLTAGQVLTLAQPGMADPSKALSFESELDVSVLGTGFLNGGNSAAIGAAHALLDDANVTVRLTGSDVQHIVASGDAALDALMADLQAAGMDFLRMDASQVGQLANGELSLNNGLDVTVFGTGFLNHGNAGSIAAAHTLLGDADTIVRLTQQNVNQIVQDGDAALDALVQQLQDAGMDTLRLESGQVSQLASAGGLSLGADSAVTVMGTGFLNHGSAASITAAHALLGDADVTVRLTAANLTQVLQDGDAALDALVQQLQAAGMDQLRLDDSQVTQLANAGFDFEAGTDVTVSGTGFLNHGSATSIAAAHALLADADVAVRMTHDDVEQVLHDGDAALDALVQQLHAAGMDELRLDDSHVVALADSGDFSFAAGTDITVTGTSFLQAGAADTAHLGKLFGNGGADVDVRISDDLMQALAADPVGAHGFAARAAAAGVDTLSTVTGELTLDAQDAAELATVLAAAGLSVDADQVTVLEASITTELGMPALMALREAFGASEVALSMGLEDFKPGELTAQTVESMQDVLAFAGVDEIQLTDDLAEALAEAGAAFSDQQMLSLMVNADPAGEAGIGYSAVSLAEMRDLGVDLVEVGDGVEEVAVALRDAGDQSAKFTLQDLPRFDDTIEDGIGLTLVVDEDDLAALLAGYDANVDSVADALAGNAFTGVYYTGGAPVASGLEAALADSGLWLESGPLNATEVQLLGLGDETANPFDPLQPNKQG